MENDKKNTNIKILSLQLNLAVGAQFKLSGEGWLSAKLLTSNALFVVLSKSVPCEDHHPKCGHWAARGECKKNVKWMSKHCKVSCGKCAQGKQPGSKL